MDILAFVFMIWSFFFNQFMTNPALLLGLVAAIGLIALRQPASRVVSGALKTAVGMLILQAGSTEMTDTFRPILLAAAQRFGIQGTIIDPYAAFPAVQEALQSRMSWVGYTIMVGFALNILLVALKRWTKVRAVFLTGHIMLLQSALFTWIVYYYFRLSQWPTVLVAGALAGLYWTIGAHVLIEPTEEITGGAAFTVGHQQMLASWLAWKISPRLGNSKDSVESIKLPGWLGLFEDSVVAVALVMLVFFGILMLSLGPTAVQEMAGSDTYWLLHIVLTALSFAVNMTIILIGVRLVVDELGVSFKGISQRVLPGAVVGMDCVAIFAFAPNAVVFGFVMGAIGQVVGMAVLLLLRSSVLIIPGFIPMFFDSGTISIYANKYGGWRAAAIICFAVGLVHIFGGAWAASLSGLTGGWQGSFDFATIWPAVMAAMRFVASQLRLGPWA